MVLKQRHYKMADDTLEKQTEEGLGLWDKVKGVVTRPLPDDYYETNLDNATGFLSRNKDETPASVEAASFLSEAIPGIGDAIAAKEVWDELQKEEPNYYLVGALGGATIVGLVPGLGDAAAKSIKKGAKEVFDVANRVEVDPNAMGSMGGNIRLRPKAESNFTVTREDASSIFGEGSERVRYTDPESKSTMEVVVRPDGRASVLDLQVPEDFRGKGLGQSLQEQVMQDFPIMGGQVSSKAAATTAYRLGRRPVGQPNATLDDVFAEIDDMSSVNLVSPGLQPKPKATPTRFDEDALRTAANQNDKSRDILVEMPIDDFLKSAEKGLVESKLEGTRALVVEGTPFSSIPNLTFKNNGDGTAKVVGHEGRHRALALKEQGETTMPVLLTSRGGDGPAIRWGQQNNPDSFDYVDVIPQRLIEEDGTGLVSMPSAAAEIRTKSGFAEGGLATKQGEMDQMNKMFKEGGLATDGMDIDPISGNDIPVGSNAVDVRDDVDAKLSEGEYVVPADVVKYFGVSYFEKLRNKAKEGLEEMQEDGRVGGDPVEEDMEEMEEEYTLGGDLASLDGYATGGLVEGMDVDGIIDRVKAAAAKDPSITNMLKAKGIFVQEPQPQGTMQQEAMSGGAVPTQAAPPAIEGQNMPAAFAEGGLVYGEGEYNPTNFKSGYNPYDHTLGFSIESGVTGQAPGTPYQEPTAEAAAPVCPDGYTWNPELKVCMPSQPAQRSGGGGGSGGGYASPTPQANPNAWMDKYTYDDADTLFNESMEKLGVRKEGAAEEEQSWLGQLGDAAKGLLSGGLAGGLVGKFMATTNAAQTRANALALDAMGRSDLGDQLRAQNKVYVKESGIGLVPDPMRDGDQLFESIKRVTGSPWETDATKQAATSTGLGSRTGGSSSGGSSSGGSSSSKPASTITKSEKNWDDNKSASDKLSNVSSNASKASTVGVASGAKKIVDDAAKAGKTVTQQIQDTKPKTVYKKNDSKSTGGPTQASQGSSRGMARGGLVSPRKK